MSESFPATLVATKLGVFSDMSGQFLVVLVAIKQDIFDK